MEWERKGIVRFWNCTIQDFRVCEQPILELASGRTQDVSIRSGVGFSKSRFDFDPA